jgi:hypothetical protein
MDVIALSGSGGAWEKSAMYRLWCIADYTPKMAGRFPAAPSCYPSSFLKWSRSRNRCVAFGVAYAGVWPLN